MVVAKPLFLATKAKTRQHVDVWCLSARVSFFSLIMAQQQVSDSDLANSMSKNTCTTCSRRMASWDTHDECILHRVCTSASTCEICHDWDTNSWSKINRQLKEFQKKSQDHSPASKRFAEEDADLSFEILRED